MISVSIVIEADENRKVVKSYILSLISFSDPDHELQLPVKCSKWAVGDTITCHEQRCLQSCSSELQQQEVHQQIDWQNTQLFMMQSCSYQPDQQPSL